MNAKPTGHNKPKHLETKAHLLLCTGPRCVSRGSKRLFVALWQVLERENIAYYRQGGHVRLTESGCLGACDHGPIAMCYVQRGTQLEQAWYAQLEGQQALLLARALNNDQELPSEGRCG